MNRYLLLTLFSSILTFGFAQPTMTAEAIPEIGMVIPGVYYEGELNIGENGPDQEWIFEANPTSQTVFTNYQFISPENAPYSELFPGTEMVMWLDDLTVYNYLRVQDNELQSLGFAQGNGTLEELFAYTTLPDGETNGIWPLTYGDTFSSESMFETFIFGNLINSGTRKRTATVDAYGTVTTPYGTWEDVLKISINFEFSPNEIDQIIFLHPSLYLPLVSIDLANFDGLNPGYFFLDISGLPTSTKENTNQDIQVSVDQQQRITLIHNKNEQYSDIGLYDMSGNYISSINNKIEDRTIIEPRRSLATGMYILRIIIEEKARSIKLFIP